MGSRINQFGWPRNHKTTKPHISWSLRYRTCERFGHQFYGGPCRRCHLRRDATAWDRYNQVTKEEYIPYVVEAFFAPSPLMTYLRGAR